MVKVFESRRTRFWAAVIFLAGWWGLVYCAHPVVNGTSTNSTSDPGDGAPWGNVGHVNQGATGIYLGGGWALTAYHAGVGHLQLDGGIFQYDGTSQRLTNANGTPTDLIMFRLQTAPPLPRLALAAQRPPPGSDVELVGYGCIAGSPETTVGSYTGFYWSAGGYKSWGRNRVNSGGLVTFDAGFGEVTGFITDFSGPGPLQVAGEGQAAAGDSGGAVFRLNGSTWQLAGMIDAIDYPQSQPALFTAYGNTTYSADIATYATQLSAIMTSTVPALTITRSGANARITWPDNGVQYSLEATSSLSSPSWGAGGVPLTVNNGLYVAVLPATGNGRFFRLSNVPPEP